MKKLLLVLLVSIFTALTTFAGDNVLQSVQIEPSGDSFNLVLVSDNSVPVKKTIQSSNRILLSLKGIRMSKTLTTVYKNVSNVDNIIVEPSGVDGLNIILQGDNASAASVTFDSLMSSVKVDNRANPKKEVLLNAPMNTYSPVYKKETVNNNSLASSIDMSGIAGIVKSMFGGSKTLSLLIFGLFGMVFLFGAKLIKGKDNDIQVGLSKSIPARDMRDTINTRTVPSMTGGYRTQTNKPYTSVNYGLKAYQNSTPSPYLQMHSKEDIMGHKTINQSSVRRPVSKTAQPVKKAESSYSRMSNKPNTVTAVKPETKTKIDSVKFLQSMSEIYEKSGRPDLANGIRTKLSKMK